jgi:hypothetical protein
MADPSFRNKLEELYFSEALKRSFERKRSLWEHPLTLLVIGFLLTGVVGTGISLSFRSRQASQERDRQENDAKREMETRHYEASTKAVVDLSNALYLRYVRAGMLKSALSRGAPVGDVQRRKELYDEALVQQEATVLTSHLLIREALVEQDYNYWERKYQYALKPRLSLMDKELTDITDTYVRQRKSGQLPASRFSCTNQLYEEVRVCDATLVNAIFRSLSSKQYLSGKTVVKTEEEAKHDVDSYCPEWQGNPPACRTPRP